MKTFTYQWMRTIGIAVIAIAWVAAMPIPGFNAAYAAQFDLVTTKTKVSIYYQKGGPKLDSIAAHLLAADIERVSGYLPEVGTSVAGASGNVIVLGRVGSDIVGRFGKQAADDALKGEWERYSLRVLDKPVKNVNQALIIAGSDVRGTAYGAFAISEKIGVTPWYWWADAVPATRKVLSLNISNFTSDVPSVKFRGIFINDEDWGLQPWAARTFEPETKDIGPKTYAKVFELLLRLKANLIWPAMHPSTKAFYHYPGNVKAAGDYQIVVGSSHAEPMLRNNVSEWNEKTMGHFNFVTNRKKVEAYWESRIRESAGFNGIYTTGMRGVHDGEIQGVKTLPETVTLLDTIIRVEREMLQKYVNKDITKVPQVFTPYKEVLEIYDAGLKVPEDITLVWPDDNYGYIQRLSNEAENKRPGGSGVYYHASYWGRPHDYLWLNTTHPAHIREEMTKAFALNARHLWVLNIGDIKPGEYAMQVFLDMAYNAKPFEKPGYSKMHLKQWLAGIFGDKSSAAISEVLWKYYNLAFERKPEYMGWSQTEPTTGIRHTAYNHHYYGDQAQQRIDDYNKLVSETAAIRKQIAKKDEAAFYELVDYPVKGAAMMNRKFLYRDKAYLYARQGRVSAAHYALLSKQAYAEIVVETGIFNEKLLNGKWKGMMDMQPRELPVFKMPDFKLSVAPNLPAFRALPEGLDTTYAASIKKRQFKMPAFDRWNKQKRFIDVFLTQNTPKSFRITASEPWIKTSVSQGELSTGDLAKSEQRIWVEIDWANARIGELSGNIKIEAGDDSYNFKVTANNADANTLPGFKGYVANDKYISIHAAGYTGLKNTATRNWGVVDALAGNGNALQALPLAFKGQPDTTNVTGNPSAEYDFYTFADTPASITVSTLPTYPLNKDFGMRYAVKVDDGPVKIFNFKTIGRSNEWKQNVLANSAKRTLELPSLSAGMHKLTIYMIDPGVVLQHIFIDLGSEQAFYGTLPPTVRLAPRTVDGGR
ncbi:Glycosyl hydrolase family 115 [Dyadobacter sp. SG02]|uniref:glycosyl hydrolase 115 family protein n=1 Tax=Dyadobacter sp. SG02 TaxID=1855291 RepID=UPI0008BB14D3|nr:glycosyl hydrolase 115 family protein [Dyadobacter sp. SG02]SEJ66587.1 Glycosyl hydrolase family 115 [Dyadobacter sp. SG02]